MVFNMRNLDPEDSITCVYTMLKSVALGTMSGKVILIDSETGAVLRTYEPHRSKVTMVYLKEDVAVISSSVEGKVTINFNDEDLDTINISLNQDDLTCFCTKGTFNPSKIEFFYGTRQGKLRFF